MRLGVGPFVAYGLSRTVGVPGDPGDVANWGHWVGTVSLLVEAALVTISVSMLLAPSQRTPGTPFAAWPDGDGPAADARRSRPA